jgi:mannose-1-phosphate guanylyltransferase
MRRGLYARAMGPLIRHALLLTAGLGTRLRPLTLVRAKPAIPLAGEPLIRRIVRRLASSGVTELVVNLHYRPETLTATLGDGSDLAAHVRYSWEYPQLLGSAGGPRLAVPIIGTATFFIVNGDSLTDLDLEALSEAHRASGAVVTLALVPNLQPDHYGGVRLDDDGAVTGFAARGPSARGTFHFIGVQIVSADAFQSVQRGAAASSIGEIYDQLIAQRPGCIRGFLATAAFWDIGTVTDYWRTSVVFAGSDVTQLGRGRNVQIWPGAALTRSIVWNDVIVEEGSTVDECIVTDGVRVAAGSSYRRSVLRATPTGVTATPFEP